LDVNVPGRDGEANARLVQFNGREVKARVRFTKSSSSPSLIASTW
jgi:hypothetical protein